MNHQLFKILFVILGITSFLFPQDFWRELPAPTTDYTYSSTNRIVITPSDDIYIVGESGIHKSTDGGMNWNSFITAGQTFYVSETGNLYAGRGFGGMALFRSSDGGLTWDSLPVPYRYGFYSVLETADGSILVGLDHADAILKSSDRGSSFSVVFGDTSYSFGVWNSLLQDNSGKIYAMQDYRTELYTSVDNGTTWDTLPMPVGTERLNGYSLSRSGRVYYTTETGSILTPNGPGTALTELSSVDPTLPLRLYTGNMVCARDDGLLLFSDADNIVASYDNGVTWVMDMSGMDTTSVSAIEILDMEVDSRDDVYVYGPRGLYKNANPINTVGLVDPNPIFHNTGSSLKIFPNLFRERTQISFNLSKSGLLKIMGIDGKTFASYDISNRTGIVWEGKDNTGRLLPPGVYFIETNLDGKISTGRVILSK